MRGVVYVATSLDGFIARRDGSVDWLGEEGAEGVDYGFADFMRSIDVLVMGRNTYEVVRSFGVWPYGETPVVVLTRRGVDVPAELAATVEVSAKRPTELAAELEARGHARAYVDGGRTIQSFLAEELIDELTITRLPIVLGTGIPLFGPANADLRLEHVETKTYESGYVQTRYTVR